MSFEPGLVNVVPRRATFTVDHRNPDEERLRAAETVTSGLVSDVAASEGVSAQLEQLARFEPVVFDEEMVRLVEQVAADLGHPCRRIVSGAGHDAQMMARLCPTAMVFVPSAGGISHSPAEHTEPTDLVAGADVLLPAVLRLAGEQR